jgi:hypothetical protein
MILIWGLPGDRQIAAVLDALGRFNADCFFCDQHKLLQAEIDLHVGARVSGRLRLCKRALDLEEVTAVYLRPYEPSRIPAVARAGVGSPEYRRALEFEDALSAWSEVTPALVVNRLSDMAANGSKPYQGMQIQEFGWKVPDTSITTDPEEVQAFLALHGTLIYKSISGVRSVVSRFSAKHDERLRNLRWCPTQFQKYVAGQDFRVHVVGAETFASRIVSSADDYRYAWRQHAETRVEPAELPPEVTERCCRMAQAMNLKVAGIDLRHTPDDEWYCFEVNPSPGFTYYQDACGFAIDAAIASLLMSPAG